MVWIGQVRPVEACSGRAVMDAEASSGGLRNGL